MSTRLTSVAGISLLFLAGCSMPAEEKASAASQTMPAQHSMATVGPIAPPTTDAEMIASAMSAAPEAVSKDATIVSMDDKMQMRTLRQGTNGWTCMPDGPSP